MLVKEIQHTIKSKANGLPSVKNEIPWYSRELMSTNSGISDKLRESFYRELHMMISTGLDLRLALSIFSESLDRAKHKKIFFEIQTAVVNGTALASALENSKSFSKYEFQNIRIGEESGTIVSVLGYLADHFKNKINQKRLIINALSYPILVLITSCGAVFFMLRVVVPMFEDVFKRFDSELPWLTQQVINLSQWMEKDGLMWFFSVVIFVLVISLNRKKVVVRDWVSRIIMRIPFFGQLVIASQLSKFCAAMHLLVLSRYPLLQSLILVREMIDFYPIEKSLVNAEDDLMSGVSLHESLKSASVYPIKMIAMIRMAEEVNKLDVVFGQLSQQYSEDVKYRSQLLSSVLEPILIIFIGVLVGFILISMYLPLFELSTTIE